MVHANIDERMKSTTKDKYGRFSNKDRKRNKHKHARKDKWVNSYANKVLKEGVN